MPTRMLATADFDKFAKKAKIADTALVEVIERAERGIVDADLGGGLVKLRLARPGQGRSGGYRTLVAFVVDRRAVFLLGYAKNRLDSIGDATLADLRQDAHAALAPPDAVLDLLIAEGELREILRE